MKNYRVWLIVESSKSRLKGRDSKMLNKIGGKYQINVLKAYYRRTVWNLSDLRNSGVYLCRILTISAEQAVSVE